VICIVNYGMGNLRSAQKGFEKAGHQAMLSTDPRDIERADGVVVPGVGAFKDCFDGLKDRGMVEPLQQAAAQGKPLLGICVGLQLLFEESEEGPGCPGLGILPGKVVRFPDARKTGYKVPHMGWNRLSPGNQPACAILPHLADEPFMYFVHSFYAQPNDPGIVYAQSGHGVDFAAVVGKNNVFGVQFHPEKSQEDGILVLKAFGDLVEKGT
jgi:imidazole glycerol-phosphate synthase subunit HisH